MRTQEAKLRHQRARKRDLKYIFSKGEALTNWWGRHKIEEQRKKKEEVEFRRKKKSWHWFIANLTEGKIAPSLLQPSLLVKTNSKIKWSQEVCGSEVAVVCCSPLFPPLYLSRCFAHKRISTEWRDRQLISCVYYCKVKCGIQMVRGNKRF